jgi:hypothetical protein
MATALISSPLRSQAGEEMEGEWAAGARNPCYVSFAFSLFEENERASCSTERTHSFSSSKQKKKKKKLFPCSRSPPP